MAIVLVCVFSFGLSVPLLHGGKAESNLPACCKRDGKHGCGMRMETKATGPLFQKAAETCPYWPKPAPATHASLLAAPPAASVYAALVSSPTRQPQTEAQGRISFSRVRQKRGPPSFLSH